MRKPPGGFTAADVHGRDDALVILREALVTTSARAAGVLLSGVSGIGKTTLLETAVTMADGFRPLRAAGVQLESELRFAGLHQLLAPLGQISPKLPIRQRRVLESVLAIGEAMPYEDFAVAAAVLAVLAAAAEQAPLLLALDDAQWIDEDSLQALLFAFRRLRGEGVALVIAARPVAAPHVLLAAPLRVIRLQPLDANSARAVVAAHAPPSSDTRARDRIVRLAGGVPLALVELAALGDAPGDLSPLNSDARSPVLQLVEQLFGRRLDRLSVDAAAAAVIAALDEPEQLDAFVRAGRILDLSADAWEQADRASILRLGHGRVDFAHPLLREAVLARTPGATRRATHRALGQAMAARGDEQRAVWHEAAGTVGADEALAVRLERSAKSGHTVGHLSAAQAFARAAGLSRTATGRARRLLLAAERARYAGQAAWAQTLSMEARAASQDPLLRARADLAAAHIEARRGSSAAAFGQFQRVADEVFDVDPELAAETLGFAAAVGIVAGDLSGALAASARAGRIPPGKLSAPTLIAVRESLGFVLALRGETARARILLEEVASWYERQPERAGAEYVAEALMWLGDFGRVRRLLDDLAAEARRLGNVALLIQTLVLRADLGYRTAAWQAALVDAHEAVALAEDAGLPIALAYALAMLAILEAVRGSEDASRTHAERAMDGARRHDLRVVEESAGFALGLLELAASRPEVALARLQPIAVAVSGTGRGEPAVTLWPAELVEALILADRKEEARAALDTLAGQASTTGGAWVQGIVGRYRGVLAGENEFEAAFDTAIEHHADSDMPFELARTRLCYGQRLRRAGRRLDARAQLRDALTSFESLSAIPWVKRVNQELTGSGEKLRRGPQLDRDELTPQELQIADFIATGATNREVAADLFLSPKTIETHLTRVYRKLGIRSRSQLVLLMAESESRGRPSRLKGY